MLLGLFFNMTSLETLVPGRLVSRCGDALLQLRLLLPLYFSTMISDRTGVVRLLLRMIFSCSQTQ